MLECRIFELQRFDLPSMIPITALFPVCWLLTPFYPLSLSESHADPSTPRVWLTPHSHPLLHLRRPPHSPHPRDRRLHLGLPHALLHTPRPPRKPRGKERECGEWEAGRVDVGEREDETYLAWGIHVVDGGEAGSPSGERGVIEMLSFERIARDCLAFYRVCPRGGSVHVRAVIARLVTTMRCAARCTPAPPSSRSFFPTRPLNLPTARLIGPA